MGIYDSVLIVGNRGMLAKAVEANLAMRHVHCNGVDRDECDITDAGQVRDVVARFRPTLVVNCAAFTAVDKCETETAVADAVNGTGVGHLAAACRAVDATLVHVSTDYVFDGTLRRPLKPDDPVGPQSAYGRSKLLGERLLQQHAPRRWLILRTAWLYGPGGPNFPDTMLKVARAGKPLTVVSDQHGSPTFTHDLAAAMLELLDRDAHGIWHVSNAGQTTWFDFARCIFETFGVKPLSLAPITSDAWKAQKPDAAVRPAYSVFDVTPYERLVGEPMPTWTDALARYRRMVEPAA
jgi:dTDP-4-dehydrorhamnose reductase